MENNILNELRTPVFLVNKYNIINYINEIGEEFFGVSSSILILLMNYILTSLFFNL